MISANLCKECFDKTVGSVSCDVITGYKCDLCGKNKQSGSSSIPGYCCPDCSKKNLCCEECGSLEILTENQKEKAETEYWNNYGKTSE